MTRRNVKWRTFAARRTRQKTTTWSKRRHVLKMVSLSLYSKTKWNLKSIDYWVTLDFKSLVTNEKILEKDLSHRPVKEKVNWPNDYLFHFLLLPPSKFFMSKNWSARLDRFRNLYHLVFVQFRTWDWLHNIKKAAAEFFFKFVADKVGPKSPYARYKIWSKIFEIRNKSETVR